jgi:hypothetical protein
MPIYLTRNQEWAGGVAQVVECLPGKSLNPSTTIVKKKKKRFKRPGVRRMRIRIQ